MWALIEYEYKKIVQRKSVWISIGTLLFVVTICANLPLFGNVYVDNHKVSGHFEETQIRRQGGEALRGAILEESFLAERAQEYQDYLAARERGEITWENWLENQKKVASSQIVYWWMEGIKHNGQETVSSNDFYTAREKRIEEILRGTGLSQEEIQEHRKQNLQISTPIVYSYNEAYERFAIYWVSNLMILGIAAAVCTAPIFAEEYNTRVNVIQLSSAKGRGVLIGAKLIAGFSFAFLLGALVFLVSLGCEIFIYGPGNLSAPIQVMDTFFLSTYPLTTGEMLLLLFVAGELSLLVLVGVVMYSSSVMNASFGPVIVGILFSLLPILESMIPSWLTEIHSFFSMLPGCFAGYASLLTEKFWKFGGIYFRSYQYVPVLYGVVLAGCCVLTYKGFTGRKISG